VYYECNGEKVCEKLKGSVKEVEEVSSEKWKKWGGTK